MMMRHCGHTWRFIDEIFTQISAHQWETSRELSNVFFCGDLQDFFSEGRGAKHHESFYDIFPELETEGKMFAMACCSEKHSSFKVCDLTEFIDRRFYEITVTKKLDDRSIRSDDSCRLDLRRWDGSFDQNSQRTYFEGHQRRYVVKHRKQFTSYSSIQSIISLPCLMTIDQNGKGQF
jgi:hypothetical protein